MALTVASDLSPIGHRHKFGEVGKRRTNIDAANDDSAARLRDRQAVTMVQKAHRSGGWDVSTGDDGVMTENSVSRPLLHLFLAYFHEDWDLEAADWQGLLDGYVRDEEPDAELLRLLANEIDDVNQPSIRS
ncbi:hypothetical protein [Mycolicibacterium vaccae]|nr:hypothetical protein [Mycolicibacterium vaccae]